MFSHMVPDTSKAAIGARLAAVRRARAISSGAMATAMKMTPQRWSNYEQGRNVPPPEVLSKFWQITGATADYVLFGRMDGLPNELYEVLLKKTDLEQSA